MNGLAEIKAINDHAALKHEDDQRRMRGLKPRSAVGEVLRKNRDYSPKFRTTSRSVLP